MKDITLKIVGKQCFDDREEDQLEFVTDGKLFAKKGELVMTYEESELSGMPGVRSVITLRGNSLRLKRIGNSMNSSELFFKEGERVMNKYPTPVGEMNVELLTHKVINDINLETLTGNVYVEYDISLEAMAEGKNKLMIYVS